MLLEVCFDSEDGLQRALTGGAGRFEVCSRLDLDGLTPSDALLRAAIETGVPSVAMVRPRGGSHVWSVAEHAALLRDAERVKHLGAHGLVFGAVTPTAHVDRDLTEKLVRAAHPLPVTFHRAFDAVTNRIEALESLIELGVARILTSGGAKDAYTGRFEIRALVQHAAGRIEILPGGGVRAHNAAAILAATGVRELHSSTPFPLPTA